MDKQYYIATAEGEAEGPYSLKTLQAFLSEAKIQIDTLVCMSGGQEWVEFKTVLEAERQAIIGNKRKKKFSDIILDKSERKPAWLQIEEEKRGIEFTELNKKLDEQQETQKSDAELFLELFQTIEGIFRVLGTIALIAGFILLFSFIEDKQPGLGFIYLISGILSCLMCFWFAKVLTLLQKIADKK